MAPSIPLLHWPVLFSLPSILIEFFMTRFSVRYEFFIDNGGFHDVSPSNLNALIGAMGVLTEELMGFGA